MKTVAMVYEAHRADNPGVGIIPWDRLTPTDKATLIAVAEDFAEISVDQVLSNIERQVNLATDRQIAALDARPDLKVARRKAP